MEPQLELHPPQVETRLSSLATLMPSLELTRDQLLQQQPPLLPPQLQVLQQLATAPMLELITQTLELDHQVSQLITLALSELEPYHPLVCHQLALVS
jgi:hypothetical protein